MHLIQSLSSERVRNSYHLKWNFTILFKKYTGDVHRHVSKEDIQMDNMYLKKGIQRNAKQNKQKQASKQTNKPNLLWNVTHPLTKDNHAVTLEKFKSFHINITNAKYMKTPQN